MQRPYSCQGWQTSDRIVELDVAALDAEALRQMRGEGLHAVALGRMVSGGDVGHAGFLREVRGLF